jgi:hypothetical protein
VTSSRFKLWARANSLRCTFPPRRYNVSGQLTCNDATSSDTPTVFGTTTTRNADVVNTEPSSPSSHAQEQKTTAGTCGKIPHSLTASWGGVCCNEHLNMVNIMARGTGRDFFWPPNHPRGFNVTQTIENEDSGSCRSSANDPTGYPASSDPFSTMVRFRKAPSLACNRTSARSPVTHDVFCQCGSPLCFETTAHKPLSG